MSSASPIMSLRRIAIIGPGLLGGSVGLGLRAAGFSGRIIGVARQAATLETAQRIGCIDEGATDLREAIRDADLIILATPARTIPGMIEQLDEWGVGGAVVTDVGSTKAEIVAAAHRAKGNGLRFLGSHPMAGKTTMGPESAEAELFRGKPCILTPTGDEDERTVAIVESLWRTLGMTILRMTAEQHDLHAASVSHLPHVAAVALIHAAIQMGGWEIASTGFDSTTRLAASNPPMRLDIMQSNRAALTQAIDVFSQQIERMRAALKDDDGEGLLAILEEAKQARETWIRRDAR